MLYGRCVIVKMLWYFFHNIYTEKSKHEVKRAFHDYTKDCWSQQCFQLSYSKYIESVIDKLIDEQDTVLQMNNILDHDDDEASSVGNVHIVDGLTCSEHNNGVASSQVATLGHSRRLINLADFNFQSKHRGHLGHQATDFQCIGPDRKTVAFKNIEQYLQVAQVIKHSKVSNYKQVRIPIESGLNIRAWENRLDGYPDKRLIQYLKFGFPLSISSQHKLTTSEVQNHFSALHYPKAVTQYLEKNLPWGLFSALWMGPTDT